jgi:hypothetical protein
LVIVMVDQETLVIVMVDQGTLVIVTVDQGTLVIEMVDQETLLIVMVDQGASHHLVTGKVVREIIFNPLKVEQRVLVIV